MSLSVTGAAPAIHSRSESKIAFSERAALLFGAAVLLFGAVLWAARGPNTEKTDFSITYVGATILRQGDAAHLYDLTKQASVRDSLYTRAEPLIFEHPPFEALVFVPLTRLPYKTAYLAWGIVNAVIWLLLPFLLRPYCPVPRDELSYFALWFLFAPLGVALYQGQPSLLLLLLYALTFISLKRGQDLRGGLLLGLGLFKFQFVLPFVLIFLLRRQWRFFAGFSLSAAALGALSLFAVGLSGVWSYIHLLMNIANHPGNASFGSAVGMATVRGFVYAVMGRIVGAGTLSTIVAAISLSLVVFTAWYWQRCDAERENASFDLMFATSLAVALATGFHMFAHDLSPLMLAMFLAAAHFPEHGSPGLRWLLGISLGLLWIPPLHFALLAMHSSYLLFPVLMALGLAACALAKTTRASGEGAQA